MARMIRFLRAHKRVSVIIFSWVAFLRFLAHPQLARGALLFPVLFGCLGNHEIYTQTEDSITRLFAAEGIRVLRQERAPIRSHGEVLNLIGVDYQQARFSSDHDGHLVDRYLEGSEKLVMPTMVNILLNHNPNCFDRAAELGIDLVKSL